MSPKEVLDSISNRNEHVVELAKFLGKGRKLKLFEAVYAGKRAAKPVSVLAKQLGWTPKAVLTVGKQLVDAHAFSQAKLKGETNLHLSVILCRSRRCSSVCG